MKIDSSIPSPASRPLPSAQKTERTAEGGAARASGTAAPAHRAAAPVAIAAPFDSRRVAEIRQSIADGQLQVDADRIADRLLDGVRELLARNRPAP